MNAQAASDPPFQPPFLRAMEGDSAQMAKIFRVDAVQTLDVALLMLTHFAANVPRSDNGGILEIARNFLVVPARPKIPEWLDHISGFLAETRELARSASPKGVLSLTDLEIRDIRQHVRYLARFGMMFANDIEALRDFGRFHHRQRGGRFMLGPEDGPLMPKTGMLSHVALVLEGPGHLRSLRAACRQSRSAILHRLSPPGRLGRLSLAGWCDLATVAAAMRAKPRSGAHVDWLTCSRSKLPAAPALPGKPLLLPAPPDGPWDGMDLGLMPWVCLAKGFSEAFCEMVRARFLHEELRFRPDAETRPKLRQAAAAEDAAIRAFPARFGAWAEPVRGLSRALVVLFLMLGAPRKGPADNGPLVDLALEAATRIRCRSLDWLRHIMAAELTPDLQEFDRVLYEKLLMRGPRGTRELCRVFHRLKRAQLDEAAARLVGAGLVEQSDGMLRVRGDPPQPSDDGPPLANFTRAIA